MADDVMRARMVDALAAYLEIPRERASAAMHHIWEQTKDHTGGPPLHYKPDVTNPGVELAHRVQKAIDAELKLDDVEAAIVVAQARTGDIGLAMTYITAPEAEWLLRLGMGALRRTIRQQGEGTR